MRLLLQVPVTARACWMSFCVSYDVKSSSSVSRRQRGNHLDWFLRSMCGCQLSVCVCWGLVVMTSGSRNGWTETKRKKESWMQLYALVKGKVTPFVTSSLHAANSVTMETQLMNNKIAANHSVSVLKVHGGGLYF